MWGKWPSFLLDENFCWMKTNLVTNLTSNYSLMIINEWKLHRGGIFCPKLVYKRDLKMQCARYNQNYPIITCLLKILHRSFVNETLALVRDIVFSKSEHFSFYILDQTSTAEYWAVIPLTTILEWYGTSLGEWNRIHPCKWRSIYSSLLIVWMCIWWQWLNIFGMCSRQFTPLLGAFAHLVIKFASCEDSLTCSSSDLIACSIKVSSSNIVQYFIKDISHSFIFKITY